MEADVVAHTVGQREVLTSLLRRFLVTLQALTAHVLDNDDELRRAVIFIDTFLTVVIGMVRDNVIDQVGTTAQLGSLAADRVLDLAGYIVMPGMVNTHHHMYQNLTRVMVQDDELFVWLTTLYPIWAELDDDAIYVSARVAMAELMQSGCTTSSDHLYILPNNATLDAEIRAAREVGIRFHAARGAA